MTWTSKRGCLITLFKIRLDKNRLTITFCLVWSSISLCSHSYVKLPICRHWLWWKQGSINILVSRVSINLTSVSCMIQEAGFSIPLNPFTPLPHPIILLSSPQWPQGNIDLSIGHNICTHHHLSTPLKSGSLSPLSSCLQHRVQRSPVWNYKPLHTESTVIFFNNK